MSTELAIRKQELKLEHRKLDQNNIKAILDVGIGILLNPAFDYVFLVLLLEYLCTHPKNNFELFGSNAEGYISKDTAKVVTGGLTAALAANAFGGGEGIASIISALEK
jgi:hypothetical protein